MSSDTTALREQVARTLHDANTGQITPDPADPTLYGAMADAALAVIAADLREWAERYRDRITGATEGDCAHAFTASVLDFVAKRYDQPGKEQT